MGLYCNAVSAVIGVLLLLGIALLLSITVVTMSLGFATMDEKPPQSSILVQSYSVTSSPDIKIQHKGGDRLMAGDWWISIVPVGKSQDYRRSSTDFAVGDQIITFLSYSMASYLPGCQIIYKPFPLPLFHHPPVRTPASQL